MISKHRYFSSYNHYCVSWFFAWPHFISFR